HTGKNLAHLFGQEGEVRDHLFGRSLELCPEVFPLRGDAGWTGIDVALPSHRAPHRDERRRAEAVALGAEERGDHHIATGLESPIGAHLDPMSEAVANQDGLRLCEPELPG